MYSLFSIRASGSAFKDILKVLTKHRRLTYEMAKREITDRYAGQMLGALWAILSPLVQMFIYVFIFVFLFSLRKADVQTGGDRVVYILSGLVPYMMIIDVLNRSSVVVTSHSALVKQVIFPIEILPVKTVCASALSFVVSIIILIGYVVVATRSIPLFYCFIPIYLFFLLLGLSGICFILSALGVYLRDLKDIFALIGTVLLYGSPIFYTIDAVPAKYSWLLLLNPLTYPVQCSHDILYHQKIQHPYAWCGFIFMSLVSFVYGYRLFRKLQPTFGDRL